MIKLVVTDIDGVWTDGGMYYTENGDEIKKFSVVDGVGVNLLKHVGIPVVIMTGENSAAVTRRAKKLRIDDCFIGVHNKKAKLLAYLQEKGISMSEVAYIGDEINDLPVLRLTGFTACPAQSPDYVKEVVQLVLNNRGGEGAFKEFAMAVLNRNGQLKKAIEGLENSFEQLK